MTKSIKKIFAALLVVATLALMIPFSASAARDASTDVTFKLSDSSVVGKFKFDIYKLADITTSTGSVTTVAGLPTDVKTAVEAEGTDANTTALINACKSNLASLGSAVKTWDATTDSVTYTDLTAGIYYIHPVAKATATKIADSIVTTPKYDDATKSWVKNDNIDLASKVSTKDIVLDKTITKVDNTDVNAKYATAGLGSTVEFKLEANVPGSATSKLKKYAIADKMDAGLSFNKNSVKVYYTTDASSLRAADLVDADDYTVDAPFTAKDTEYTFAVNFKADTDGYVKKIYDADKKMVVVFNATVNENATVGKTSNDNKVSLDYANDDTEIVEPGPTVQVFTFKLQLVKADASDSNKKLKGATFELYNEAKSKVIETGETDAKGEIVFSSLLAKGTYYVKETVAPEGYVLPTGDAAWTEIKVTPTITQKTNAGANDAQYELTGLTNAGDNNTFAFVTKTVKNVKITVPKTGGMGTTLFTICGASLIVLAGVMFVVLKRKKTSK